MNKYKSLHIWMIIPMIFMQFGIFRDYWGDFSENAWSVHIHYWTGTVWYSYLIFQPYFATHGQMNRHRTNGIVGMFIAGAVCFTAFSMLNRDIVSADNSLANPERFGPFQDWFFFGVAAVEIVMMLAFGYAVIKSIIHRKQYENHAWWLISTVFLIMMPALGRGIQNIYIGMNRQDWPDINIMMPIYLTQFLIIAMIILTAIKFKKLNHQATYIAIAINLFIFLLEPLGKSGSIQDFLRFTIRG